MVADASRQRIALKSKRMIFKYSNPDYELNNCTIEISKCRANNECQQPLEGSECLGGECLCPNGYYPSDHVCVPSYIRGTICRCPYECETMGCVDRVCRCPYGYYFEKECRQGKSIGEECIKDEQCSTRISNTQCVGNVCKCNHRYDESDERCVPERSGYDCHYEGYIKWFTMEDLIESEKYKIAHYVKEKVLMVLQDFYNKSIVGFEVLYRAGKVLDVTIFFKNVVIKIPELKVRITQATLSPNVVGNIPLDPGDIELVLNSGGCSAKINWILLGAGIVVFVFIILTTYFIYWFYLKRIKFNAKSYVPWKQKEFRNLEPYVPGDESALAETLVAFNKLPPAYYKFLKKSKGSRNNSTSPRRFFARKEWKELAGIYLDFFYNSFYDFDYDYTKYDMDWDYELIALSGYDWQNIRYKMNFDKIDPVKFAAVYGAADSSNKDNNNFYYSDYYEKLYEVTSAEIPYDDG